MPNICTKCNQPLPSASDTPCTLCKGDCRIQEAKDKDTTPKFVRLNEKTVGKYKTVLCPRCNGAGTELPNKNRRNSGRGKSFERVKAKAIKEWWSKYDPQCDFQRTPSSGGSALKVGWELSGDISTNSRDFPLHIECKNQKLWKFDDFLTGRKGGMQEYIEQSINDTIPGKIPTVVFTHPGPSQPSFIMILISSSVRLNCLNLIDKIRWRHMFIGSVYSTKTEYWDAFVFDFNELINSDVNIWADAGKTLRRVHGKL